MTQVAADNEGMTITEFLEARIAEDEAECNPMAALDDDDRGGWATAYAARVLAECAAKRAIIDLHKAVKWTLPNADTWPLEYWHDSDGWVIVKKDGREVERMTFTYYCERFGISPNPPDKELLALAAVYAGHPDYRQEWA